MSRTFRDQIRVKSRMYYQWERQQGLTHSSVWKNQHHQVMKLKFWKFCKHQSLRGLTREDYHLLQVEILEETGYLVEWRHRRGGYMDESDKAKDFHK